MNFLNGGAESGEAVRCSAWLAVVFLSCFMFGLLVLGPMLSTWWMTRQSLRHPTDNLSGAGVQHVAELGERRKHLIMYLPPLCRVCLSLLLLKGKLLLQKALLKIELLLQQTLLEAVGETRSQPRAKQRAEDCAANSGEKSFVCHRGVVTTANIY